MLGRPTVAGTRITVDLILERLAAGENPEQVLQSYPRLSEDGLRAALNFAWVFMQNVAEAFRSGRLRPELRSDKRTLRDAIEVLSGDALTREGASTIPGDLDGGFLGSVLRKVDAASIEGAEAFESLSSVTIDEAAYLLEDVAHGNWEEVFSRRRGRRRGPEEVRVVLAFASEAIRNAYGRGRPPRI